MNANAAYQVPVQQRRRRISRQEMLRRKRAIRRRKRIVCFLRVSFAIVLLLTAVSFWQDYGHEILPAVNHLYYQLTARYDLPVVQYDFAALREENESDAAGSLSTTADTVSITEALADLPKIMPKPRISWQTTPTDKIIWDGPSILLPMFSLDRCLCSCNGTSAGATSPTVIASSVSPAVVPPVCPWSMSISPTI